MHKDKPVPHVHAEVIKAWASGEKIQYSFDNHNWKDCTGAGPSWSEQNYYRVKPKPPKVVELYSHAEAFHGMDVSLMISAYSLLSNFSTNFNMADNLKLVFCGVTGKLLQAELVKHEKADEHE